MERQHKRRKGVVAFNMISLMDIFTILVFFLLVNSSDVEVLPSSKALQLPESTAEQKARETIVVMVNDKDIVVQGRKVATVADAMGSKYLLIAGLKQELDHHYARSKDSAKGKAKEITIMGDQKIPFLLLKKIMLTCSKSRYSKISLAVVQKSEQPG